MFIWIFRRKKIEKNDDVAIKTLFESISKYSIKTIKDPDKVYELTKRSFDEVKQLTEYEDAKANRILATVSFVSALNGGIFLALVPKDQNGVLLSIKQWGFEIWGFYLFFVLFLGSLILGIILILSGTRPRFRIPEKWKFSEIKSFLFFEKILDTKPEKWGAAFLNNTQDVQIEYIKCFVLETYLIAQKIRIKLNFLQDGIKCLRFAILILIPWLIFCSLVVIDP